MTDYIRYLYTPNTNTYNLKLFLLFMKWISFFILLMVYAIPGFSQYHIPHLTRVGNKTQLIVQDKPFLILGGELGNSTATTSQNMESVWPRLKALNLNTVLIPVYWELIESKEGKFDFSLYRDLILKARANNLKIVFLWFGVWKNSMSSHAPAWVKLDQKKYPRVKDQQGKTLEILSSFSEDVLNADSKAFEKLITFIRGVDSKEQTVILIQVENEIGMLSSARDYQSLAETSFRSPVPKELIDYFKKHKNDLIEGDKNAWQSNGYKTSGNWEDVFGHGLITDELFMAYYYSKFVNKIAAAGKKIYPLPMYVNATLNRPGRVPGDYPSAGPLPHLLDVWKSAGNSIDFMSPDFYNPDFKHWCDLYTVQGDPLFVPEHAFDGTVAAKALYVFSQYEGLGFSPFSIESLNNVNQESLSKMYSLINNMNHLISSNQGKNKIKGVLLNKINKDTTLYLGKYELSCKHDYTLSWTPEAGLKIGLMPVQYLFR